MPAVARRYAGGLLAAAENPGQAEAIGAALEDFDAILASSSELKFFLFNPLMPAASKKGAVKELLANNSPLYAANFLYLLIDKNRLGDLREILDEYRKMRARTSGLLLITATSAQPLTDAQTDEIARLYKRRYGAADAKVENRVDASLLGGIRIQIGDVLTDDSLSGRLRGLAAAIAR